MFPILAERFANVGPRSTNMITFDLQKEMQPNPALAVEFAGVEGRFGPGRESFVFDQGGLRVSSQEAYRTREHLFELMRGPLEVAIESVPQAMVKRASVLLSSNVNATEDPLEISDYVTTRFEVPDRDLGMFLAFRHDVTIDLQALASVGTVARVVIESAKGGRNGLDITVDVLDHSITPITKAMERLDRVKDLETHVFEAIITDKVRSMYAPSHR